MLLQLEKYDINITCVPGKYMYIADMLSQAFFFEKTDKDFEEEIEVHTFTASNKT